MLIADDLNTGLALRTFRKLNSLLVCVLQASSHQSQRQSYDPSR